MVAEAGSVASVNMSVSRALFDPADANAFGIRGMTPAPSTSAGPAEFALGTPPRAQRRRGRDEQPGSGNSERGRPEPSRARFELPLVVTSDPVTLATLEDFRQHMVLYVQSEKAKVMGVVEHEMKRADATHALHIGHRLQVLEDNAKGKPEEGPGRRGAWRLEAAAGEASAL